MSTLDEITKEKQRVSEALGRVDAQRDKLTSQLYPSLTLPNEVRDPIGDVVLDELVQRILAGETLRPNNFEPKLAKVSQISS
jgi:hypothetical protein